jgi:hypothetical protein
MALYTESFCLKRPGGDWLGQSDAAHIRPTESGADPLPASPYRAKEECRRHANRLLGLIQSEAPGRVHL